MPILPSYHIGLKGNKQSVYDQFKAIRLVRQYDDRDRNSNVTSVESIMLRDCPI